MRDSFSASGVLEIIRSLYEHDIEHDLPKPSADKTSKPEKPDTPKAPASRKKRGKNDYLEDEKEDSDEENEESEDYNTVFVPKGKDSEYAIKAGHASRKLNESAEKISHATIHVASPPAKEAAEKFSRLYEAKAVLSEISGMLTGTAVKDAQYLKELNETTSLEAGNLRTAYRSGVVKIEYADPVFINNQWTYQRIFMKNDGEGSSIYDLTINKADSTGLETRVRHDSKFNTFYFESLNGAKDGQHQAYWEVWVNGNIVEEALDKKELKKGDVVEWRLANERESFCGGGGAEERFIRPELRSRASNPSGLPMTEMAYLSGFGLSRGFGQSNSLHQNYMHTGYGGLG